MAITALAHLAACVVISMIGGYGVAEMWEVGFVPASAFCLFLLAFAQNFRP